MNLHGALSAMRYTVALAATLALLAACGGGSGGDDGGTPPPASPGFELTLGATSVPVRQDSSGLLLVRVERQAGFTGTVELTLANPPAGIASSTVVVEPYEDEARLPLRFQADVPLGAQSVVVSGSGGGATATANLQLDVQAPQPNSQALIQAAFDAGQIDLGTSLLYRAYAAFGDERLPEAFVGSGAAEEDIALFTDIEDARPNLPQSILDQLQPYLARPDDPLSVFNQVQPTQRERPTAAPVPESDRCSGGTREWITLRSERHPVRAWALCLGTHGSDETARNNVFRVIDVVDQAYGAMVALMGPAKPDLWGDEAIDVYVVPNTVGAPRPGASAEHPYQVGGGNRGIAFGQAPFDGRSCSGFLMMPNWRLAETDYQLTLIHELFHVLQFAHNCRISQYWFSEASATWASFHFNRTARIRPDDNKGLHDERFGGYQKDGHGLLSYPARGSPHPYQSYVWPLFMEFRNGAESIGDAWRRLAGAATHEQATHVLDFLFPFKDNLLDYAWRNLNKEYLPGDGLPRDKRYKALDDAFPDKEHETQHKSLRQDIYFDTEVTVDLEKPLESLSAGYFEAEVKGSDIRQVVFELDAIQIEGLRASALVNIDGTWESEPRNLDGKRELRFCLDKPEEKLKEIVLIVANVQKDEAGTLDPRIVMKGSPLPCAPIWEGTVTTRFSRSSTLTGEFQGTTMATVAFEYDDTAPPVPDTVPHRLRGGSYTHETRLDQPSRNPPCRTIERASGVMGPGPLNPLQTGSTTATLDLVVLGTRSAQYLGSGATAVEMVLTSNCNDRNEDETIRMPGMTIAWWAMQARLPVSEDGKTLAGSLTTQDGLGGTVTQTWELTRRDP